MFALASLLALAVAGALAACACAESVIDLGVPGGMQWPNKRSGGDESYVRAAS